MTTIHIRITVPTITGVNVGAKGRLRWTPTLRRNVDPNTVVLPKGFDVDLVSGEARVNVAPTSANWCWKVEEGLYKVGVPNGTTRYVSVPDSETVINYIDLPDLDPSTLEPTAAPAAIWDVELSQVDERVTTLENAPPAHTHDNKDALDLVSGTNTGDEPDASDTVKGIVELATNTETATGTDTVRATTPAGVKAALDAKTVSDMSTYAAPTGADDRLQVAGVDVTPGQVGAAPALGADDNYVTDAEKLALHSHSNKTALDKVSGINTGDEPAASETVAGVVELATTAETTTGMDDTRAVTPVGVKAALDAKAASDMSTYVAPTGTDDRLQVSGVDVEPEQVGALSPADAVGLVAELVIDSNIEVHVASIDYSTNTFYAPSHGLETSGPANSYLVVAPTLNTDATAEFPLGVYPTGLNQDRLFIKVIDVDHFQLTTDSAVTNIVDLEDSGSVDLSQWHFEATSLYSHTLVISNLPPMDAVRLVLIGKAANNNNPICRVQPTGEWQTGWDSKNGLTTYLMSTGTVSFFIEARYERAEIGASTVVNVARVNPSTTTSNSVARIQAFTQSNWKALPPITEVEASAINARFFMNGTVFRVYREK